MDRCGLLKTTEEDGRSDWIPMLLAPNISKWSKWRSHLVQPVSIRLHLKETWLCLAKASFRKQGLWVQQHSEYRVWQKIYNKNKTRANKKTTRKPKPRKKQEKKQKKLRKMQFFWFFSCVFCFFWWFFPSICFVCDSVFVLFFLFLWFFLLRSTFPCSTRGQKTRDNHGFYHHRCAQDRTFPGTISRTRWCRTVREGLKLVQITPSNIHELYHK